MLDGFQEGWATTQEQIHYELQEIAVSCLLKKV